LAQDPLSLDLVELDQDMIRILEERYGTVDMITIHNQDVLRFHPKRTPYSVIANIPYYITSPILFHFLYQVPASPGAMVIMMQQEVAEKIIAGDKKKRQSSYLSLAVEQACASVDVICAVPRESFDPIPKVDSLVLRFILRDHRDREEEKKLLRLWDQAFTQPRKTLISNLQLHGYTREYLLSLLEGMHLDPRVRAEALSLEDWKKIL